MSAEELPILVVGGGPVGLTAANLLAARGLPVILVERHTSTSNEAKAISLDDESLRALDAAGLAEQVLDIVVPGTGTRYYDRRGRMLFHARGPESLRLGFPFKNQFAQPELERVLLQALQARPNAEIHFGLELRSLRDLRDRIVAAAAGPDDAGGHEIEVSWVLGCDGGRSAVRELRGIGMTGTSHDEVWLVVDTLQDHHDERYGLHYGTPDRPTVVIPGRNGRCRYEFLLHAGEGERNTTPTFESVQALLRPFREVLPEDIERATNYTFNAVVADRWRDHRCLLLGDAAHMMPPFAGQGLNSGVRDAANLVWKLEQVWRGQSETRLLDTYERERRPHAEAMVRYSERLGHVVMTTRRSRALLRDLVARAAMTLPAGRRVLTQMRFRPQAVHRAGVVAGSHPLTGRPLPQPQVLLAPSLRATMLDNVLGTGWALLGVDLDTQFWERSDDQLDAILEHGSKLSFRRVDVVLGDRLPHERSDRTAIADADGRLEAALAPAAGLFVLVRPDRYVAAVCSPHDLLSMIRHLLVAVPPSEAPSPRRGGESGTTSIKRDLGTTLAE